MQRLLHGRVVVAASDAVDIETSVLRVHWAACVEDHAGSDRRLTHRVTDVETLEALG